MDQLTHQEHMQATERSLEPFGRRQRRNAPGGTPTMR